MAEGFGRDVFLRVPPFLCKNVPLMALPLVIGLECLYALEEIDAWNILK
jgi:hypothetical protein